MKGGLNNRVSYENSFVYPADMPGCLFSCTNIIAPHTQQIAFQDSKMLCDQQVTDEYDSTGVQLRSSLYFKWYPAEKNNRLFTTAS
jgi:hypothetical protein